MITMAREGHCQGFICRGYQGLTYASNLLPIRPTRFPPSALRYDLAAWHRERDLESFALQCRPQAGGVVWM
jgi:hypothetical protein